MLADKLQAASLRANLYLAASFRLTNTRLKSGLIMIFICLCDYRLVFLQQEVVLRIMEVAEG